MREVKTVYIIGFMGSGKSTAGKKLASALKCRFVDLDDRIESRLGMKIPDIFEKEGEKYFREMESVILREMSKEPLTVVSTGGGTPCYGGNMAYMLETGLTIYLKLTPEQLKRRLSCTGQKRPLLKNVPGNELLGFITKKLEEREPWYNRAALITDGARVDYNLLISLIKKWLDH